MGWKNTPSEMLSNKNICNNTNAINAPTYNKFFCIFCLFFYALLIIYTFGLVISLLGLGL